VSDLPHGPECGPEFTYEDGNIYVCPECAHEWAPGSEVESGETTGVIRDTNGNVLEDGGSPGLTEPGTPGLAGLGILLGDLVNRRWKKTESI